MANHERAVVRPVVLKRIYEAPAFEVTYRGSANACFGYSIESYRVATEKASTTTQMQPEIG